MNFFRLRDTGEIVGENILRAKFENIALPTVIDSSACDFVGVDPILHSPQPSISKYQTAVQGGVEQDALGNWVWVWTIQDWPADQVATHRNLERANMAKQIDDAVSALYVKPMTFSKEYEQRELQAQAYKDAGYTGDVPARVAGFATPAGMSPRAATDLILSQAATLRGALDLLSDLRMRKYEISRATADDAGDDAAQAAFVNIMTQITAIAKNIA